MYRLITESLLGIRLESDKLYIEPCLPDEWDSYKIYYKYRETNYRIVVKQVTELTKEVMLTLDGTEIQNKYINLMDDRREHIAEFKIKRGVSL
jgi:cellobiose phosphorylase